MRALLGAAGACCLISIVAAQQSRTSWAAPSTADAQQNPLAGRTDALPGGKKLFQQRCSSCHREDGTGTSRGPNLMVAAVQKQSDGALVWKISSGNSRTGMPSFSFLPEPQRWQLVLYLRSLAD
jgi:mono/diheme cytochrome c family protein